MLKVDFFRRLIKISTSKKRHWLYMCLSLCIFSVDPTGRSDNSPTRSSSPEAISSFEDWCEASPTLSDEIRRTVDALMVVASVQRSEGGIIESCSEADLILSKTEDITMIGSGIKDLRPLESFTQLRRLDLKDNQITDISFLSNLVNLSILNLEGNQITDIGAIQYLENLTVLNLNGNPILNLEAIKDLTKLGHLEALGIPVDHNKLYVFEKLRDLYVLKLSETQIEEIDFLSNHPNLNTLFIRDSSVKDISIVAYLSDLKVVDFSGNPIQDITPLLNLSIQDLSLARNKVRILPASASSMKINNSLRSLDINDNNIEDISLLINSKKLVYLNLCNNNLSSISEVSALEKLTHISLCSNRISDISPISELKKLQIINLDYNPIQDLSPLSRLENLTHLSLKSVGIESIESLGKLARYKESHGFRTTFHHLDLSDNQVSDLTPLEYFDRIETLNISYNLIRDITPLANLNISDLNLSTNQITDLEALRSLNIEFTLDLRNNPIDLENCPISSPNPEETGFKCYFD